MTKEEIIWNAVQRLDSLEIGDPEQTHSSAEEILKDALRDLDVEEIAKAFHRAHDRCGFWYA